MTKYTAPQSGALRAYTRILFIVIWTCALFALLCCVFPLALVSARPVRAVRRYLQRLWARGTARIMGMHVKRIGAPPKRPYYLVANHLTYLDVVALSSQTGCVFVAMAEIAGWPVLGFMAKAIGTIFIDRSKLRDIKRVNEALGEMLDKGEGVLIFAESTTSWGNGVLPFKPALFETPAQRNIPVHYAALHYETCDGSPTATQCICWVEDIPFFTHGMGVLRLPRYTATVIFGDEPVKGVNRRALADATEEAVKGLLPPIQ